MTLLNMKLPSVPPSPVRARGGSPGHIRRVRIDINPTPQDGKVRSLQKHQATLARTCQPGSLLVVEADHAVGDAEDLLITSPEAPRMYIHINDNYCVTNPVLENWSLGGVAETLRTLKSNVSYCFVSPVPFPTRNVRQPQKKICELCFFCRSVCFCPICSQCPQCCSCSSSRRLSTAFLAGLGAPRSQPKGSVNFERGLHTTIQSQTPTSQRPHDNQWLCRPP